MYINGNSGCHWFLIWERRKGSKKKIKCWEKYIRQSFRKSQNFYRRHSKRQALVFNSAHVCSTWIDQVDFWQTKSTWHSFLLNIYMNWDQFVKFRNFHSGTQSQTPSVGPSRFLYFHVPVARLKALAKPCSTSAAKHFLFWQQSELRGSLSLQNGETATLQVFSCQVQNVLTF